MGRFIVGSILRNKLLVLFSILVALNLSWIFEQTGSNPFSKVLVQHWSQIQNMALCELLWRWLLPAQAHPVQLTDIKRYWASVCYGNPWVLEWIKKETLIYLLTLIKCEPNYYIFFRSAMYIIQNWAQELSCIGCGGCRVVEDGTPRTESSSCN